MELPLTLLRGLALLGMAAGFAAAQTCAVSISPTSASFAAFGNGALTGTISVTAPAACSRPAASNVSWITINYGQTGTGNGTVGYTVDNNTFATPRTGTINIAGQIFTVTQAAANCSFNLQSAAQSVPAAGGSFSFALKTSCTWTPASSASWIHISTGQTTGDGTVNYAVDPNPDWPARSAAIAVGTATFSVSEAGTPCGLSLASPPSAAFPIAGGTFSFAVTASPGCNWRAAANASWIAITSGAAGTGSGTIAYTLAANNSAARSGAVTVTADTAASYAIRQAGVICAYTIDPVSVALAASGGKGTVSVVTDPRCGWAVASHASWITTSISPSQVNMGPGPADYTVAANPGVDPRTGTMTIAGQTFTVNQAGAVLLSAVNNGASYAQGAVSPGEIVTLFGAGMGPATPATFQLTPDGQALAPAVAGTRVLFDGTPAPLIYSSDTQVSAVVPYSVAGKASTQVQVEYQGVLSNPLSLGVVEAAPGIFTLNAQGFGAGAVLNQDYSVNSPGNPAPHGSVVMIFATGEGATDPPGVDGQLAAEPLPHPLLAVTVRIGGIDAPVLYSGSAPGEVAGLLQVNARIPDGVPAGDRVAVVVRVGQTDSQTGVTISIAP